MARGPRRISRRSLPNAFHSNKASGCTTRGDQLDVVVDSTLTASEPSTVIEVDGDQISLIRLGAGPIDGLIDEN